MTIKKVGYKKHRKQSNRKHSNRKHSNRKHSNRKHKKQSGGEGASQYELSMVGKLDNQINSVFGPGNTSQSNALPNPLLTRQPLDLMMNKGGSKKRKSVKRRSAKRKQCGKSKRGGFFGSVLNQGLVPFSILAMQQSFRRKKSSSKNKTYKR